MAKICQVDGCNYPVFSSGYCKYHGYKIKPKSKREAKFNKKKKTLKVDFGFKTQVEMFNHKWNIEPHKCWLTGALLNFKQYSDEWFQCFAHVLRKGVFTYWKLNPENIRLLHPDVHHLVDNFIEEYLEQYPDIDFYKWFDLQDRLRVEYTVFKIENLLA
jgi:hypothetical protein